MKTILLVLFAAACSVANPAPATEPHAATVGTITVERRDVPLYIGAVGSLDGYVNAEIRARVRGYLKSQDYKDGAAIKAGQMLFAIDGTEYRTTAASAQASVARARVTVTRTKLELERVRGLSQAGMISQQEVDNVIAAAADARAQLRAAQAQGDRAALDVGYAEIRSPIDGVAGLALVRVGNLVGQDGPTLLTTVSQLDPMRVNFPVSEVEYVKDPELFAHLDSRDLAWAQQEFRHLDTDAEAPGVEIVLADGRTYSHRGTIVAVNRQVDPTNGTVQVQALVPNPDGLLRPGEYARVRISRTNDGKNVVVVPDGALIAVQGTYSVAVVGRDHKVTFKKLELGPSVNGIHVVLGGLAGGEQVIVEGLQRVTDGATVDAYAVSFQARS